ncbi:MAG TPA: ABC transporter permease [Trebonia sp.]|jgi:ABC-2 type transport system permease protein|nr:ABC transporter permease [Trebonia sp.]
MSDLAAPPRLPSAGQALATQIRYQLILLTRNPRALMTGLVLPSLLLALELGRVQHLGSTPAGMAVLAPSVGGLFLFSAAAIALFSHALSLVVAREAGILRRWRAAPLPAWGYFAGKIVATVLAADLAGVILVLVSVEMAKLHLTAHAVLAMLVIGTLGGLALAAAGTALTALISNAQSAQPVLMLTYLPLVLLSGAFGTIQSLPHWVTTVVSYLPAQPITNAISQALLHSGGPLLPAHDLAVLGGWLIGGLLLSVRFFRWDPGRPRHGRAG